MKTGKLEPLDVVNLQGGTLTYQIMGAPHTHSGYMTSISVSGGVTGNGTSGSPLSLSAFSSANSGYMPTISGSALNWITSGAFATSGHTHDYVDSVTGASGISGGANSGAATLSLYTNNVNASADVSKVYVRKTDNVTYGWASPGDLGIYVGEGGTVTSLTSGPGITFLVNEGTSDTITTTGNISAKIKSGGGIEVDNDGLSVNIGCGIKVDNDALSVNIGINNVSRLPNPITFNTNNDVALDYNLQQFTVTDGTSAQNFNDMTLSINPNALIFNNVSSEMIYTDDDFPAEPYVCNFTTSVNTFIFNIDQDLPTGKNTPINISLTQDDSISGHESMSYIYFKNNTTNKFITNSTNVKITISNNFDTLGENAYIYTYNQLYTNVLSEGSGGVNNGYYGPGTIPTYLGSVNGDIKSGIQVLPKRLNYFMSNGYSAQPYNRPYYPYPLYPYTYADAYGTMKKKISGHNNYFVPIFLGIRLDNTSAAGWNIWRENLTKGYNPGLPTPNTLDMFMKLNHSNDRHTISYNNVIKLTMTKKGTPKYFIGNYVTKFSSNYVNYGSILYRGCDVFCGIECGSDWVPIPSTSAPAALDSLSLSLLGEKIGHTQASDAWGGSWHSMGHTNLQILAKYLADTTNIVSFNFEVLPIGAGTPTVLTFFNDPYVPYDMKPLSTRSLNIIKDASNNMQVLYNDQDFIQWVPS